MEKIQKKDKKDKIKDKIIPLESWYKISEEFDATRNYTTFGRGKSRRKTSLIELNFLFVNDSEVSISIIDAVALVKYSKDLLKVDREYTNSI